MLERLVRLRFTLDMGLITRILTTKLSSTTSCFLGLWLPPVHSSALEVVPTGVMTVKVQFLGIAIAVGRDIRPRLRDLPGIAQLRNIR